MSNNIYLVVGRSGVGKTSVANKLCEDYGLKSIKSYTTRKPRYEDEKGHIFISDGEFDGLTDIIAETRFDNHRYCSTKEQIDNNDLYVVDLSGVETFKERYDGNKKPIVLYLTADENVLIERMENRGDSEKSAKQRIVHDKTAFANYQDVFKGMEFYIIDCDRELKEVTDEIYTKIIRSDCLEGNIILYSKKHCPSCEGLKRLLNKAQLSYEVNDDEDFMISQGFSSAPILEVDGIRMHNKEAVIWVNERISAIGN